jgi:hypothetical protein
MSEPVEAKPVEKTWNEPVVITLRKPITFGSRTITELTIRPCKGKDLRRIDERLGNTKTALSMAGWLSGEPTQVIDELEGQDLGEVMDAVNGFLFAIRGIGESSSES